MKDKTGKTAERLKSKKLYLLDMDGTIYLGNELFPFTKKFLKDVEKQELYKEKCRRKDYRYDSFN